MAALNIANDLLRERKETAPRAQGPIDGAETSGRIHRMHVALDAALGQQDKLF